MRHVAPLALLLACACGSGPAENSIPTTGRRHHVVVNSDVVVLDFVLSHGGETIDLLTLNVTRNTNANQTPIDLSPLAKLKSVHTLSLAGFTVLTESRSPDLPPTISRGLTDVQVNDLAKIRTLRRLDVRSCGLTEGQRKQLKSQLPQCEIREN